MPLLEGARYDWFVSNEATVENERSWTPGERSRTRRAAMAGGVGTMIEYYDFGLYGYLAVVVAPLFFPNTDPVVSLLSALAVFGSAFLIRPVGGLVFGHIGDRYGRRRALVVTLVVMGVASTALGLLPTYGQIGVAATVLLVLIRLLQGFSAGGEVGGAATFISESTPARLRAFYGSFTPLGATAGFAVAASVTGLVSALTTEEQMTAWGWRIPFLLALPLTLFCLWMRTRVDETHPGPVRRTGTPLIEVLRHRGVALAQSSMVSVAVQATSYIGLTYMSIHLIQRLGYPPAAVYWTATAVIAVTAVLTAAGGLLGDRVGADRIMMVGLVGFLLVSLPVFALLDSGLGLAALAYLVFMVAAIAVQVGAYAVVPRLFDPDTRYTGVATGWNIGSVLAGGTAPFVAVWLIERTGSTIAPAWFVMTTAVIGLGGILWIRRTAPAGARAGD